MPRRPTKEFFDEVYPSVRKGAKSAKSARAITGAIWYRGLKPSTKREYEHIRAVRERHSRA
jgi:hypothetical protein